MKNEYDNERFFEEYAQMPRSRDGLAAAGEWRQLKPLFPPLQGKTVLDLGCGYGWHCIFAAGQGAARVLGLDLSRKMIEEAGRRNAEEQIEYRVCGMEEYEYPDDTWDCVVSNLALHYIEDIENIFQKVYRTLKPGGVFIFNIEHPVFTAGVGQDGSWCAAILAGGQLFLSGSTEYPFPGVRCGETAPHAHTNSDGTAAERICAGGRRGGGTSQRDDAASGNEGRTATSDDAIGESL